MLSDHFLVLRDGLAADCVDSHMQKHCVLVMSVLVELRN